MQDGMTNVFLIAEAGRYALRQYSAVDSGESHYLTAFVGADGRTQYRTDIYIMICLRDPARKSYRKRNN